MPGDSQWGAPWEERDDENGCADAESVLDVFDDYVFNREADDYGDDSQGAVEPYEDADDEVQTLLFTASNPAETVSVTVLMDGRVLRVELSPKTTTMSEAELAEEITTTATLARDQALAGQHAVIVDFMRQLGHDEAGTRSLLERELHLPSPETVYAEQARLFSAYYGEDRDRPNS